MDYNDHKMNDVFLDDEGLIRVVYHGKFTQAAGERDIRNIMAIVARLEAEQRPILVLADTRDMGAHTLASRQTGLKAREVIPFSKMAIITNEDVYIATISKMITSLSKRQKEIGYFDNESDALKWLHA